MKYKMLITTSFRKFVSIEAKDEQDAIHQIEEQLNKGEIEGTDTFDFETNIEPVSPIDEDYERSWGPIDDDELSDLDIQN